jgi:two-component system LytT family sensor kinase
LFWLVVYAVMIFQALSNQAGAGLSPWFGIGNEAISLLFFMVLVYVNLLYLIPRYLARQVPVYIGLVLALCALLTPIRVMVLYLRYSGLPAYQYQLVQNQWTWYVNIFGGHILVTGLSTVLRVIMDWWRYQNEKQLLVTQTMQSELRFLKSQINPHFLFNTLNNLYALTLKKSDKAPEIVLKLSEIMRYMLYECNEKRVLLTKEIQYIHNYLDLERLRQTGEAEISFTTEGRISEQLVAPLLFVPFLENSFKHGLNHHVRGGGFVRLHLRVAEEDLEFTIENSKPERLPRQEHARSGGIGLANVRQRLKLLYPENHALEVQDEPHRFAVTLQLKLI